MTYWDDLMGQAMGEIMGKPLDLVLGRRTYDIFRGYWPNASEADGAKPLNDATKYVASRGMPVLDWGPVVHLEGDAAEAVAALKQTDGPELQVHGSGNLIQSLLRANLIPVPAARQSHRRVPPVGVPRGPGQRQAAVRGRRGPRGAQARRHEGFDDRRRHRDVRAGRRARHRDGRPFAGLTMATYGLIPGAGGDAWQWHLVARELEARGHVAVPVTLPTGDDGAGWNEYADAVVRAIGDRSDVILVAQSLAGFTAPLVCERRPVELIVLLNAMIPVPGETGNDWWSNTGSGEAHRAYLKAIGLSEGDAGDDRIVYFHDVPDTVVDEAFARGEPQQSMTPMSQPFALDAWPDVPTRVIAGRDDRLFPVDFQRRVARERLGIEPDVLDGGHMLCLSQPRQLAEQLERYREELGSA
jgi:pimeloyl-ACP methyl ester carboxylesterase